MPNRDIYIITKSLLEQYSSSKNKIKEIGEEIIDSERIRKCYHSS